MSCFPSIRSVLSVILVVDLLHSVETIFCATSSSVGTSISIETKECDKDIQHCMIALGPAVIAGEAFERHSYGCWPWRKLVPKCPLVNGVCQILETANDALYGTCCCYGNMCNNQTLVYLSSPNSTAEPVDALSHPLAKFGLRDDESLPLVVLPTSPKLPPYLIRILLPCLFGMILILFLAFALTRSCSPAKTFRRKLKAMHLYPNGRSGSALHYRRFPLCCSTLPYTVSDKIVQPNIPMDTGLKPEPDQSNLGYPQQSYNFDSLEWSVMQLISQSCQTERCLGRGRFAQVWFASVPAEVLLHPLDILKLNSQPSASGDGYLPIGQQNKDHFPLANHNHSEIGISKQPVENNVAINASNERDSLISPISNGPLVALQMIPSVLHPTAVKVFRPHESTAWSTELSVFQNLQPSLIVQSKDDLQAIFQIGQGHSNVVRMLGAGVIMDDQSHSIREYRLVMEYASGGSLRSFLSSGEWLSVKRVIGLCQDIVNGLTYLHGEASDESFGTKRPIAHRDLKPENILLRSNGTACLSDFGQAVILHCGPTDTIISCDTGSTTDSATSGTALLSPSTLDALPKAGTLRYMAPELLDGAITFSGLALLRTDMYSIGLVLWEILCAADVATASPLPPSMFTPTNVSHEINGPTALPRQQPFPRRRHYLPYELELGLNCSSPLALRQWVSVEKHRPSGNSAWCGCPPLLHLFRTITECWDPEPEARLTADCVLERLAAIQADWDKPNPTSFVS